MADPQKPSKRRRVGLVAFVCVLVAACAKVAGIDGLEVGECKGGGTCLAEGGLDDRAIVPGEDGPVVPPDALPFDGAGKPCPSGKGAVMVRVGTSENNFCIDETEVTVKQYGEFTSSKDGSVAGQPTVCAWNKDYTAATGGQPDIPVAGIDWCDARAYCEWAGKRLCGKHQAGIFIGSVAQTELTDFTTHEWLVACSNLGQLNYPYGVIQQPTTCNTGENDAGRTLAVKSKAGCQGGFPGVFDMVGNLWEWYDGPCRPFDAGGDAAGADAGPG